MKQYEDENGVRRNLLGITSKPELHKREYASTQARLTELRLSPIEGKFDMDHLRAIHRHLFQDIYGWAGKTRELNFSKVAEHQPGFKGAFAKFEDAPGIVDEVGAEIARRNNLRGLDKEPFVDAMVEVFRRLNHAHPFPEGNGRSTQALLSQLAEQAGHKLDFQQVRKEEWNRAAAMSGALVHRSVPGLKVPADVRPLREAFARIVDPKTLDRSGHDQDR